MNSLELISLLVRQVDDLAAVSDQIEQQQRLVLERKQMVAQANEALTAAEAAIAQGVLSDVTLSNESKRQAALRDAKAKDPGIQQLTHQLRDASNKLALDQALLANIEQRRQNLQIHSQNLRASADLLTAELHNQAQSKRQVASQQFLQASSR
jgi:hypothetical protein